MENERATVCSRFGQITFWRPSHAQLRVAQCTSEKCMKNREKSWYDRGASDLAAIARAAMSLGIHSVTISFGFQFLVFFCISTCVLMLTLHKLLFLNKYWMSWKEWSFFQWDGSWKWMPCVVELKRTCLSVARNRSSCRRQSVESGHDTVDRFTKTVCSWWHGTFRVHVIGALNSMRTSYRYRHRVALKAESKHEEYWCDSILTCANFSFNSLRVYVERAVSHSNNGNQQSLSVTQSRRRHKSHSWFLSKSHNFSDGGWWNCVLRPRNTTACVQGNRDSTIIITLFDEAVSQNANDKGRWSRWPCLLLQSQKSAAL